MPQSPEASGSGFSWKDTSAEVLARIAAAGAVELILVGGQAVNFWVEKFRDQEPLLDDGPFTSKDVDVLGSSALVRACASALGGEPHLPSIDHATPEVGKVVFRTSDGRKCELDFLDRCPPNGAEFIRKTAVVYRYPWGEAHIMHPFACMRSRAYNVIKISTKYDNPHGIQQLRASILVLRHFIPMLFAEGRDKPGRELLRQVYRYSLTAVPRALFRTKGIDTFDAVALHPALPRDFVNKCFPRWRQRVERDRGSPAHER